MDIRVKTFVAEAGSRFGAVLEGLGFTGPQVDDGQGTYPLMMCLRYHRDDVSVETSLVLAYAGEEYVQTSLLWGANAPGGVRCVEVGSNTAHTGYQMRRALDRQVQAVPGLLEHPDPGA